MKLELLNNLIKIINKMKCDIIVIENNKIYGTDCKYSILKTVEIPYTDIIIATSVECIKWSVENNQEHPSLFVNYCYNKIHYLISTISNYTSNSVLTVCESNIRQDDNFENITQYKASDGVMFYRTNGYCIALYKALLNLNKNDKVDLKIYDRYDQFFLTNLSIVKKECIIELFMECRKI